MNLKIARIKQGLNQRQLAKLAGVCQNTLVKLERDEIDNVRVDTLKKISKVLGIGIVELFFNNDQE